jgi:hypothetical protein
MLPIGSMYLLTHIILVWLLKLTEPFLEILVLLENRILAPKKEKTLLTVTIMNNRMLWMV